MRYALAVVALLVSCSGIAQSYPSRAVTSVVGFAPGGGTDTVSRIIAKTLGEQLGQQVITDNKAGAGGNIATDHVAKAAPDGYTILLGNVGSLAVAPHLVQSLPYDPLRDLAPITMAVVFPNLIVLHPSVPANTLAEFIKLAKEKPGTLTYGSSGIGGAGHLAGELLKMMAKVDIVHVPFKGGAPAVQSVLAGDTQLSFATPPSVLPLVQAGRLRALAVTSRSRTPLVPGVPGMEEAGLPQYEISFWYGLFVPAGSAGEVTRRLFAATGEALDAPAVAQTLAREGTEISRSASPGDFAAFLAEDAKLWARLVKESGAKAE
jgi:tripartite-type tricarboxylate transporter receptor subunit TctC